MSLFHLALQVLVVCVFVAALMVGLFSAPWYVLFGLLIVTFVLTWLLMPGREAWLSQFVASGTSLPSEPPTADQPANDSSPSKGNLTYRGVPYSSQLDSTPDKASVLTYRGTPYAKGSQASEPQMHDDSDANCASPPTPPTPELKYRGARVNH